MNIVIVGLGEVGSHLAKVLASERHAVTVIDADLARIRRATETIDVRSVQGDGSKPDVLDQADAGSADLLLAVSNDDNVNMLVCLFGKRMGAKRSVLRVKDMTPFQRFRTFFRKNLLFDQILSLEDLAAEEIVKSIRESTAVGVEHFADGRVQMRRVRMAAGTPFLDQPLRQLKIPSGVLITAIHRGGEVLIPDGNSEIRAGDEIFVLGEAKGIAAFEKKTGLKSTQLRRVIIFGSSGIARQVAIAMQRLHVETKVLVEDKEAASEIAARVPGAVVLHGSGTDVTLLREEHVGDADAFLGLSDQDETNLMSCQLARSLDVGRTVALVHKPDYVSIYQTLGIDIAVSPRLLCANRILSFVRSGSVSTIATIAEGKAEVLEIEVKPSSRIVGKTLAKAHFPKGAVVGAIARESGEIVIPRGEDSFAALDNLVIFALREVVNEVIDLAGAAISESEA